MLVSGTLDLDPEKEEIIFQAGAVDAIRITNGGLFRVGNETVINGITRYSQGDAITMPRDAQAQFAIGSLEVQNGGRFEWRGGAIYAGDAMGCLSGGTAELFAGRFVTTSTGTNTGNASAMVMRNDRLATDVISHGITLDSLNPTTAGGIIFSRNGLETFVARVLAGFVQQRNGTWTDAIILRGSEFAENVFIYDYNFFGSNANYNVNRVQPCEFFNIDVGTGLRQFTATNNLNGHISFFQEFRTVVRDLSGNPIVGATVDIQTVDHGNRIDDPLPLFQNSRSFSNGEFDSYKQDADAAGEAVFDEILTGRMWVRNSNTEQLDLYSNSGVAGMDDFTVNYSSYNEMPSFENVTMHSSSEIVVNKSLLPDSSITEANEALTAALTEITTAAEFYDRAKHHYHVPIVSRVLNTINAGSLNVTLDPNAVEVLSLDGDTLTVKSLSFTGNIETTGTVTLLNSAEVLGSILDVNGQRVTVRSASVGVFSIRGVRADTDAELGYFQGVEVATFQVPAGTDIFFGLWQEGHDILLGTVETSVNSAFTARPIVNTAIDTSIDVDLVLEGVDVSLSLEDYSITFNVATQLNIEQMKTMVHFVLGREVSLRAVMSAGEGNEAITIGASEIRINTPIVFLRRGSGLDNSDRVEMGGFVNTDPARAINPLYVVNPSVSSTGLFVIIPFAQAELDPVQLAGAVADRINADELFTHAAAANRQTKASG